MTITKQTVADKLAPYSQTPVGKLAPCSQCPHGPNTAPFMECILAPITAIYELVYAQSPDAGRNQTRGRKHGVMRATLDMINRMEADGVIGRYAIGGAVGATFYLEPSATLDVDVFVSPPHIPGGSLVTLAPLYAYLTAKGCVIEKEHIIIEGWPVQFLPPSDALDEEAVDQAIDTEVEGIRTRVMTAEHLVAIALRTGARISIVSCNLLKAVS